jgi:hypothetical protein
VHYHWCRKPERHWVRCALAPFVDPAIYEGSRAAALAYAHEGAKHLYLLDFDGENLPNLKETVEKMYPDVKVGIITRRADLNLILYEGHDYSRRCE